MRVGDEAPATASTDGSLVRRDGSWWREGVVVASAFGLCLLGGFLHVDDTVAPPPAAAYVLAAVSSALLLARRRAPVVTLLATTACGILVAPLGLLLTPLIIAPAVISAYSLAFRSDRGTMLAVVLPASVLLVGIASFFEADFSWEDTSRMVTVAAAPLVGATLGRSARNRRAYLEVVEDRARRAEDERDSRARQKVAEERIRIARELHDLVAHQITLANAQATVASHLFDQQPEKSRENLLELVKTTRHALNELRATVGLLRQPDDAPASAESAPGLLQLATLLDALYVAGLAVSVREDGTTRVLSPALDLTAFRIIQESLTNVTKHAATTRAQVHLTWHDEHLAITVTNDGEGSAARSEHEPGYGLIGLRERATAVGGIFTAGAGLDGGFRVSAQLPLPTASEVR